MSMKSEFVFKFPRLGTEQKALVNPMHIEAVTAIVMDENKVDLCMVYLGETLQYICVYIEGVGLQRYYKDNFKRTALHIIYGPSDELMEVVDSDDMEEAAKEADIEAIGNMVSTRQPTFYTEEEAAAYVRGFEDAMYITDHEYDFRFVEEDKYYKLKNILGL